ncbi:MAG: hypothetical protein E7H33_09360 [Clostridium perfringens]|nr:hypothetical protein [Clostridium perfringens]
MSKQLSSNVKSRIGERRTMNCGEEAEIIEYKKYDDISIRFLKTGEIIEKCKYGNFRNGTIKSHFTPTVYGVGIIGLENTRNENGDKLKSYEFWRHILQRCYDEKEHKKHPTYKECKICDEWLYYPNFKEWYEENYYEVNDEIMCLDKDILVKGNKIYSPKTCVFAPERINKLFLKRQNDRGNLPIGVIWHKRDKEYQVQCNIFDMKTGKCKKKHLGCYDTPKEAFSVYKQFKENYIKLVADHYKDKIPERLYDAMYRYEVEIDD